MEQVKIDAVQRNEAGKGRARQCRREGRIPGVVYGLGHQVVNLSVARQDLERAVRSAHGANLLVDLSIDGKKVTEDVAAIVKKVERQPITREALCVDFQWVSLKQAIDVEVQVIVRGRAVGQEFGGIVEQIMHTIPIRCLPLDIPGEIDVDITPLNIHDSIHVRDIEAFSGVEVLADLDDVVVTVAAPSVAKAAEEAEGEEGEEEAEGEAEE